MESKSNKGTRGGKASYWTFLRADDHVRLMCKAFMKKKNISYRKAGKDLGVYNWQISNYLNKKPYGGLTDMQVSRLVHYLGLEIELVVKLRKLDNE